MINRLVSLGAMVSLLLGMAPLTGCQAIQLVDHPIPVTINYVDAAE